MNDFLRKRMAGALAYLRVKGYGIGGYHSRFCDYERSLPWAADQCYCVPWESYNPLYISPARDAIAFRQGKGWVVLYRRGSK